MTTRRNIIITTFLLLLFIGLKAEAQHSLSGKVTGFNKFPLNGVEVTTKKSKQSTKTDAAGNYQIDVASKDKISFEADGFYSTVLKTKDEDSINVNLIFKNSKNSAEMVVEKNILSQQDMTEALEKYIDQNNNFGDYSSIFDLIQSECAGVILDDLSSPAKFYLTGNSNEMLYVVNKSRTFDISYITPGEVKSVKVLKGADATMQYGNSGVNGVLEIELKH